MALTSTKYVRWNRVRGWNRTVQPAELPPDLVPAIVDVEPVMNGLGRRRRNFAAFSLTSGPTGKVQVLTRTVDPSTSIEEMWAFSGSTDAHRFVLGTWSSVTLTDTPATFSTTNFVHTAAHNGKYFLAYNSAENRLHLWDGSAVRRVGIGKPAAVTVADTGAGAYAATARYYRTSQRIKDGTDIIAESELSDAVSFTPSGAGTAARITKSATEDSATHWVVWGLIGTSGDTYDLYEELAEIAVGTTTYDDSTNPADYDGDFPAQLGLHIPPPSCKLLLSDGNRLLMAGAYETSAAADETTPKSSRVWFTRVLGSSDNGDDETIPNTTTQKNWIDIGESDGDLIVALAGPINGIVYVFKRESIWRLIPTGIDTTPYREERLTNAAGSSPTYLPSEAGTRSQAYTVVMAEDQVGQPSLYFWFQNRCYQISSAGVIDELSADIYPPLNANETSYMSPQAGVYWPSQKTVVWATGQYGSTSEAKYRLLLYVPSLAARDDLGQLRGGWFPWNPSMASGTDTTGFIALTTQNWFHTVTLVCGGNTGGAAGTTATIGGTNSYSQVSDAGGTFTPSVTSKAWLLGGGGLNVTCEEPYLEASRDADATPTISYIGDYGVQTLSATPSLSGPSGGSTPTRVGVKAEGLVMADTRAVQVRVSWASTQFGVTEGVDGVVVPYRIQEPV